MHYLSPKTARRLPERRERESTGASVRQEGDVHIDREQTEGGGGEGGRAREINIKQRNSREPESTARHIYIHRDGERENGARRVEGDKERKAIHATRFATA